MTIVHNCLAFGQNKSTINFDKWLQRVDIGAIWCSENGQTVVGGLLFGPCIVSINFGQTMLTFFRGYSGDITNPWTKANTTAGKEFCEHFNENAPNIRKFPSCGHWECWLKCQYHLPSGKLT